MRRTLLITVDVEEWYHSLWFDVNRIEGNPESLCERDLDSVLDLFRRIDVTATFFVLGEVAENSPHSVEKIARDGHEVACHGYCHESLEGLGSRVFEEQTEKARGIIERILGCRVLGFRAPNFGISTHAVNVLESLGFCYDSSMMPCLRIPGWYGHPSAPITTYRPSTLDMCKEDLAREFWEVPISVFPVMRLPGGGGWYLRNFGYSWTKTLLKACLKRGSAAIYVHPWEVSDNRPNVRGIPFHVFRRKGKYVRDTIEGLVRELDAKPTTISEFLEKEANPWQTSLRARVIPGSSARHK